ncbi:type VII secretion protein EssB [Bacillus sp. FSL W7-1360]
MEKRKAFYLEKQTGAIFERDKETNTYLLRFQESEVKLTTHLEPGVLEEYDANMKRTWKKQKHELCMVIAPEEGMIPFHRLKEKDNASKLLVAYSLIQAVKQHDSARLHLIISPENVLVDAGLSVSFIYYGIQESLPPYVKDDAKLFAELRATLLTLLDGEHHFKAYMNNTGTLKMSEKAKRILNEETISGLHTLIVRWTKEHEAREKQYHKMPMRKWLVRKWTLVGTIAALVPLIFFTVYTFAFVQPRQEAFTASHTAYLNQNYSEVIDVLEPYKTGVMPKVVKYQLAQSYVAVESLKDEQRENLRNILVLQALEDYFEYWIAIGRGENEEALDIARGLEDPEWLVYANVKLREQIRNDKQLSGKEREEKLKEVDAELAQYQKTLEEMKEAETIPASGEGASTVEEEPEAEEEAPTEKHKEEKEDNQEDDKGKEDGG